MKRTIAIILLSLASGCFNISGHVSKGFGYRPYESTVSCAKSVAEAFCVRPEWHSGSSGEAGMAHAYAILMFPLTLLMTAVECVADTITLPVDIW